MYVKKYSVKDIDIICDGLIGITIRNSPIHIYCLTGMEAAIKGRAILRKEYVSSTFIADMDTNIWNEDVMI